jgi:hypothetical protein
MNEKMNNSKSSVGSEGELNLSNISFTPLLDESMKSDTSENQLNEYSNIIMETLQLYLRHNLTLRAIVDILVLLQKVPGNRFRFPSTVYSIMKFIPRTIQTVNYIYCNPCKLYVETTAIKTPCCQCNNEVKILETNYFQYFDLRSQIEQQIHKYWHIIEVFVNRNKDGRIHDTADGNLSVTNSESLFSLTLNTDGACAFKSKTLSLWPILLTQNYLPPCLRFKRENVILVALHYGEKPNMNDYFFPLVSTMCDFQRNPIKMCKNGRTVDIRPIIASISCDLPAKSLLQQFKQYNGYCACSYCLHPGHKIEDTKLIRYTECNEEYSRRNIKDTLECMKKIDNNPLLDVKKNYGVKGLSCTVALPKFNIINGFSIDYMHCVLLGVASGFLDHWFNSKNNKKEFYITVKQRSILQMRILKVKPNREFSRLPRKLSEYKKFKANELRTLLLFILPVCLNGILNAKYLKHFKIFSECIYNLLGTNISEKELNDIEVKLHQFVKDYQPLYGKAKMVMNVHLIKHLVEAVRSLGPLWSQSLFVFEDYNGYLLKFVNGTSDVLSQISSKYNLQKTFDLNNNNNSSIQNHILNYRLLGRGSSLNAMSIDSTEREAILKVVQPHTYVSKHLRVKVENNVIYTSIEYERALKTIDYFIGINDGETIGIVKYYLNVDGVFYCMLDVHNITNCINQFKQVEPLGCLILVRVNKIASKFLYIKVDSKCYITERPNTYEKD